MEFAYPRPPAGEGVNVEDQFRKLARPLMAWSLGTEDSARGASASAGNGRARLYLFTRSPESFGLQAAGLGREIGYVLYRFDLFKPGTEGEL